MGPRKSHTVSDLSEEDQGRFRGSGSHISRTVFQWLHSVSNTLTEVQQSTSELLQTEWSPHQFPAASCTLSSLDDASPWRRPFIPGFHSVRRNRIPPTADWLGVTVEPVGSGSYSTWR